MGKKVFTLVLQGQDIKIRKKFAPRTQVVASKKVYNRKREKQKGDSQNGYHLFVFIRIRTNHF